MLNRKISNYLFYLIFVGIIAIVYLLRSVMLGGLEDRIETLDNNNIILQAQIDNLEDTVQTNKYIQESHLYELYNQVPQKYSSTELTYLIIAKLELIGIDESLDFDRRIVLNPEVTFDGESALREISIEFDVVEVEITFETTDVLLISDLIDSLNASEHLFFINYVDFYIPDSETIVGVTINFLSFYEKEDLS